MTHIVNSIVKLDKIIVHRENFWFSLLFLLPSQDGAFPMGELDEHENNIGEKADSLGQAHATCWSTQ